MNQTASQKTSRRTLQKYILLQVPGATMVAFLLFALYYTQMISGALASLLMVGWCAKDAVCSGVAMLDVSANCGIRQRNGGVDFHRRGVRGVPVFTGDLAANEPSPAGETGPVGHPYRCSGRDARSSGDQWS